MKGNKLVLKDLPANSKWCDKDHVMLLACFQLLVDFVEQEKPQKHTDYVHDKNQRLQWKEIQALYKYWKKDRPAEEKQIKKVRSKWSRSRKTRMEPVLENNLIREVVLHDDRKAWNQLRKLEDRFEKKENEMLSGLINIRKHLWC
jgi:hypothetical protein